MHLRSTGEDWGVPVGAQVSPPNARVILVDSRHERQTIMRIMVEAALGQGAVVAQATSAAEASKAVEQYDVDVAVVEIQLPLADGLAAVVLLREEHPSLVIVVCTFHRSATVERAALDAGADAYLAKPVSPVELRAIVATGHRAPLAIV